MCVWVCVWCGVERVRRAGWAERAACSGPGVLHVCVQVAVASVRGPTAVLGLRLRSGGSRARAVVSQRRMGSQGATWEEKRTKERRGPGRADYYEERLLPTTG